MWHFGWFSAAIRAADIPGKGEDRDNRLAGLGPLAGIVTGAAVGVTAAFARSALARIPAPLAAATLGALAMGGSDGPGRVSWRRKSPSAGYSTPAGPGLNCESPIFPGVSDPDTGSGCLPSAG